MLVKGRAGSPPDLRSARASGGDGDAGTISRPKTVLRTERPRLHKVILLNDDYTPREFVVTILKSVFGLGDGQAQRIMLTAHQKGVCVVAVFTREIAEEKATIATEAARKRSYPLLFTTEPED